MRLGVLDIGSNTVHLLLVDAHPGARPTPYASHKRSLSLVKYLDSHGNINPEGQRELIDFIDEAKVFAAERQVEDLLAFCTSAIRESGNGDMVIDLIESETGIQIFELSGVEESGVTFFAVRRWFGWSAGQILNFDIGGGSFEIAVGVDELPTVAASIPLGAGRLTRGWLPGDPPNHKDIRALRKYVRTSLKEAYREFKDELDPNLVTGSSKTFRSLARITGAAPYEDGPYVPRFLRLEDLKLWTNRIAAMTYEDRASLPGVSPERAGQLLAGAIVAESAMDIFGIEELRISPWAMREGLIMRRLDYLVYDGFFNMEPKLVSSRSPLEHEAMLTLRENSNFDPQTLEQTSKVTASR